MYLKLSIFLNSNKLINKQYNLVAMTIVYITCKDEKEAKRVSMQLLKKRLIACANIFPLKSMYWWQGKIVKDKENAIIAKTSDKNFKNLVKEVRKIHSYTVPCILKIEAQANKEYAAWASKELR